MYICRYIYIDTYIYIYIYDYDYIDIDICMCKYIYICMYIYLHIYIYLYLYNHNHIYIYMSIYMYLHMYIVFVNTPLVWAHYPPPLHRPHYCAILCFPPTILYCHTCHTILGMAISCKGRAAKAEPPTRHQQPPFVWARP